MINYHVQKLPLVGVSGYKCCFLLISVIENQSCALQIHQKSQWLSYVFNIIFPCFTDIRNDNFFQYVKILWFLCALVWVGKLFLIKLDNLRLTTIRFTCGCQQGWKEGFVFCNTKQNSGLQLVFNSRYSELIRALIFHSAFLTKNKLIFSLVPLKD